MKPKPKPKNQHYTLKDEQIAKGRADADQDRLAPEAIADALARHVAGDEAGTKRLVRGFSWLVWKRFDKHYQTRRILKVDVLGLAMVDLCEAVERLTADVSAEDVERRLRQELSHAAAHYNAEVDEALPIKDNGLSAKEREACTVARTETHPERERWQPDQQVAIDVIHDPLAPLPTICPDGKPYRVPSRFEQAMPDDGMNAEDEAAEQAQIEAEEREATYARLAPYARTGLARRLLDYLREGMPLSEMAAKLRGVSIAQIENVFARLERRAA